MGSSFVPRKDIDLPPAAAYVAIQVTGLYQLVNKTSSIPFEASPYSGWRRLGNQGTANDLRIHRVLYAWGRVDGLVQCFQGRPTIDDHSLNMLIASCGVLLTTAVLTERAS